MLFGCWSCAGRTVSLNQSIHWMIFGWHAFVRFSDNLMRTMHAADGNSCHWYTWYHIPYILPPICTVYFSDQAESSSCCCCYHRDNIDSTGSFQQSPAVITGVEIVWTNWKYHLTQRQWEGQANTTYAAKPSPPINFILGYPWRWILSSTLGICFDGAKLQLNGGTRTNLFAYSDTLDWT